jgi:hypothetical protein
MPTRSVITALAIVSLVLIGGRGSLAISHAQTSVASGGVPLSSLILSDPVTHAQAVMMPTTAWLAQHATATASAPAAATTSPTAPCTLGTDASPDDAKPVVNSSATQVDALDFTSWGLGSDATNLTTQITVENLSNGPNGTPKFVGGGDVWITHFNDGTTQYFLEARYPGAPTDIGYTNSTATDNLPVDFVYGHVGPGPAGAISQHFLDGSATGIFDPAHNLISVTGPLSAFGPAKSGDALTAASSTSYALAGSPAKVGNEFSGLLETADTINPATSDYQVGQAGTNCPGPKAGTGGSGPVGNIPTAGTQNNMSYFGGPVVHTIKNHIIWWQPQAGTLTYSDGSACTIPGTVSYSYEQPTSRKVAVGALPGGPEGDLDYQAIIRQYFKDVSGTAFYNLLTQYADLGQGITQNSATFAGEWTDNCGYTSTPVQYVGPTIAGAVLGQPIPGGTEAAPITQADIEAEVQRAIRINHWPTGIDNEYFVYTGYGAADCFSSPTETSNPLSPCAVSGPNPFYCAYHGDYMDASGNPVLYADMWDAAFAANPAEVSLCYEPPIGVTDPKHTVNGRQETDPIADAEVSITSHEQFETVNDPLVGSANDLGGASGPPLGWLNLNTGEIGDICAYNYGNYNPADGSNIVLHGDHYIVQQEQSNWNNGCALTPYQNNNAYGGAAPVVSIHSGANLISVPVSGITDSAQLVADMTRAGQLPAGSITEVETYHGGQWQTYFPASSTTPIPIARTDGVEVISNANGTWTPSGSVYTTAPTIQLQPGWNVVAATYPNPGLMTDTIYNQIAAEAGACSGAVLTNQACSPTITEIKTIGADGTAIDWKPAASDANGNATWPQTLGNQVPFTAGMEIYATKALTWQVQGTSCTMVDAGGVCQ